MGIYRQVQSSFWQDDFVCDLTPEEKFFFIYLLTNGRTTQCGIFKFLKRFSEVELGYNRETIEKLLDRFVSYGKILYCKETNEIMVVNWIKYNFINSKNTITCINKELKAVKNHEFVEMLYELCKEKKYPAEQIFKDIEIRGEKTASTDISHCNSENKAFEGPLEAPCKPLGEEEKEQIKIQEEEGEEIKQVIKSFNNNIHPVTPIEYEKLVDWCQDLDPRVIMLAIDEAVKHNARAMSYIQKVLNNWIDQGLTTVQAVSCYKKQWGNKKQVTKEKRLNAKAYQVIEEN